MIIKQIEIVNRLGLHARASSRLVQLANKFDSEISISKNEKTANAKSIMSVMMLAANKGSIVTIAADGDDASEAVDALCKLINTKFDEHE